MGVELMNEEYEVLKASEVYEACIHTMNQNTKSDNSSDHNYARQSPATSWSATSKPTSGDLIRRSLHLMLARHSLQGITGHNEAGHRDSEHGKVRNV